MKVSTAETLLPFVRPHDRLTAFALSASIGRGEPKNGQREFRGESLFRRED
jgi:hypothetical protein